MSKLLYLEGACGISGDMTVAALLDLGGSREKLDAVLKSLSLEGYRYLISRKKSHGIVGCDFDVHLNTELHVSGHREAHDEHSLAHDHGHEHEHEHEYEHEHDHEHTHSHTHEHDHAHENGHDHKHVHDHEHDHAYDHHHHEHRNLSDVYAVIERGEMTDRARDLAKKIFKIVAEAESLAHGCPLEEVHFHEVGAVDSIVDIVAAAVLIDDLKITECVVRGLTEGSGFVRCQHGDLPVPVPAVLNIAREHEIPLRLTSVQGEMVTPTGIAIAAALKTRDELPSSFRVEKVGVGLGKRDFGRANILRAMILTEEMDEEQIYVVECNIDDATGEMLGYAMEKLMEAGARDVHFLPCFMKKNRPAYLLRVIVSQTLLSEIEKVIFERTSTIGLRKYPVERTCMKREYIELPLPTGIVRAKKCSWNGIVRCYPEYESVKEMAEASGLDFHVVFEQAQRVAQTFIKSE
ncbi:MAG: nickel pincer cofactor biosynthesis protein LarC [Planctomycetia bacterium]|nr:nickel pincer cofactor biosynthesis protein LarC [Planctomycetia bacterium]